MTIDNQTNKLFLSDSLPYKQPLFYKRFEKVLKDCDISFEFIPKTKDIWAVDFMPVQISKERFIQFKYNPDYLHNWKMQDTISDVNRICNEIELKRTQSDIIIDGGNVIKATDKVIMCDKVFKENPTYTKKQLIDKLKDIFEVDNLFLIPRQPYDEIGHADGMIRFVDNNTVIVNDYSIESKSYQFAFKKALNITKLDCIIFPYNPPNDTKSISAEGLYINYLQMKQAIIMPTFNSKYDEKAMKVLESVFKGKPITTVESNVLAKEGGVLNCISWNIEV